MVDPIGIEPMTSAMSMQRSSQLSYESKFFYFTMEEAVEKLKRRKTWVEGFLADGGGGGALAGEKEAASAFLDLAPEVGLLPASLVIQMQPGAGVVDLAFEKIDHLV